MNRQSSEISDDFLGQLKDDLVRRRVDRGMTRLEEYRHLLTSLDAEQENAGRFAGYVAQWVDIGFQRPSLVREIVSRFTKPARARLPLHDYMYLRLAEGMIALAEEATEKAIRDLDLVLRWPSRWLPLPAQ